MIVDIDRHYVQVQGCVAASPSTISAIAANPNGYYVNIHSKQYPSGAIRAQL